MKEKIFEQLKKIGEKIEIYIEKIENEKAKIKDVTEKNYSTGNYIDVIGKSIQNLNEYTKVLFMFYNELNTLFYIAIDDKDIVMQINKLKDKISHCL